MLLRQLWISTRWFQRIMSRHFEDTVSGRSAAAQAAYIQPGRVVLLFLRTRCEDISMTFTGKLPSIFDPCGAIFGCANGLATAIETSNSVIHVIDAVIVPNS